MRRFKKKPELGFVVIPGLGRVTGDTVLEGEQYAKFCPSLLVEVPEAASAPVASVSPPKAALKPASPPPKPALELVATDAEVVAAVSKHEKAASEEVPESIPAVVAVSASVETPSTPAPSAPRASKPVEKAPVPKSVAGKKPNAKK